MRSFQSLIVLVLIAPVLCGRVLFQACSSSQQKIVTDALSDVQLLSQAAVQQSEGGRGKTHLWFGTPGNGERISDEKINERYHKLANILSNVPKGDVTFDCSSSSFCCSGGIGG
jgi:hypothetical protein